MFVIRKAVVRTRHLWPELVARSSSFLSPRLVRGSQQHCWSDQMNWFGELYRMSSETLVVRFA